MKYKKSVLLIIIACLVINYSCKDNNLTSSEPIDLKQAFNIFLMTQGLPVQNIMDLIKNQDCNTIFYFSISYNNLNNGEVPPVEGYADAISYVDYPSRINYLKFDEINMEIISPLVYPTKYEMPGYWNRYKYKFDKYYNLSLNQSDVTVFSDSVKSCDNLQLIYANNKDTMQSVGEAININWNKPREVTYMWLSMSYQKDTNSPVKKFDWIKIDDDGTYVLSPDDLKNLGISGTGIMTFRLLRLVKDNIVYTDGKRKAIYFSSALAGIVVYLKD
jgi:hypothetical protein